MVAFRRTPAATSRASISGHVKPGSLAPHEDAVTEDTAARLRPIASAALITARLMPGNEPEKDAATTSPRRRPAPWNSRTSARGQAGDMLTRLASASPSVVTSGVHSLPISASPVETPLAVATISTARRHERSASSACCSSPAGALAGPRPEPPRQHHRAGGRQRQSRGQQHTRRGLNPPRHPDDALSDGHPAPATSAAAPAPPAAAAPGAPASAWCRPSPRTPAPAPCSR